MKEQIEGEKELNKDFNLIEIGYAKDVPENTSAEQSYLLNCRMWFADFIPQINKQEGTLLIYITGSGTWKIYFDNIDDNLRAKLKKILQLHEVPNNPYM
ncbi:MAG TPA: hypothetical protein PLP23_06715 [Panacibacter sp.]|nr:hypothetical protein [Panacibacter sp.]